MSADGDIVNLAVGTHNQFAGASEVYGAPGSGVAVHRFNNTITDVDGAASLSHVTGIGDIIGGIEV